MAPKTRYGKKKRMYRRRKFNKRGYRKIASKVNIKRQVHYFTRRAQIGTIVSVNLNVPTLSSMTYTLSQLPNVSDFTALFDQYKITHVKLYAKLTLDPSAQTAVNSFYPTMYYSVDHDDSATPTSLNDMREHGRTKMVVLRPNRYTAINIKPAVLNEVSRNPSGTTTFVPKWRQWVDMAHPDTVHYGLKYALDNSFNLNPNYAVEFQAKFWFQCRDTR